MVRAGVLSCVPSVWFLVDAVGRLFAAGEHNPISAKRCAKYSITPGTRYTFKREYRNLAKPSQIYEGNEKKKQSGQ